VGTGIIGRSAASRSSRLCDRRSRNGPGRNRSSRDELPGCCNWSIGSTAHGDLPDRDQSGCAGRDGTGDINNYTVIYVTNNQALVELFRTAGLPAVFDPELAYEYTPGPMETLGELYVAASGQGLPAYFLFGTENEPPPNSRQSFLANWWFTGHGGKMKQSTSFPVISFGTAAVTLYTSNTSLLGNLIGGNTASNFSFLSVRGVYPAATMTVSFKGPEGR
jgi:hypothetical protein